MATSVSKRIAPLRPRWKALAAVLAAGVAGLASGAPARAVTDGATDITGAGVLNLLGYPRPVNYDAMGNPTTTAIDFNPTRYNVIYNEYIAFVQGSDNSGNFSQTIPNGTSTATITYNVPGRISIGNVAGSLRTIADDKRALIGESSLADENTFLVSGADLLFPLAADFNFPNGGFAMTSYVAVSIDGAGQVLGATVKRGNFPQFRPRQNALVSEFVSGTILIQQTIRLRRSTVMFEWQIVNRDAAAAHSVALQYVVDQGQISYFEDPSRGRTTEPTEFTGGNIPDSLTFTNTRVDPTFFSRFRLRGFGATPPDRTRVAAINSYYPPNYYQPALNAYPDIVGSGVGPGVILDWNAVSIPAGGSRTIITYFGNGAATEDLSPDYVTGTEAAESLQYNTAGNDLLTDSQKTGASLQAGAAFLSPSPITVYGSVYNQTPSDPEGAVPLENVSMTLLPPVGLRLGTNATTGQTDTATKTVGRLPGDTDGVTNWTLEPTGEAYGPLVYQLAAATPPLASRTISRVINVPATPLRTFSNADWQLVSFPFAFDATRTNNGDPSTILNAITKPEDIPGGVIPIYRWISDSNSQTGEGRYERVTQLGPGVAYFYRPSLSRTVFLNGAVPVPQQAPLPDATNPTGQATPFQVTLNRGWNMIGNPYVYNIPLAYIRVVPLENNPSLRSFTFAQAVTAGFIRGALFFYVGQTGEDLPRYDFLANLSDPITPWIGYWLFANDRCNVIYAAPTTVNTAVLGSTPTGLTGTTATAGAVASGRALIKNPTLENWKLQLQARTGDGRLDRAAFVGVSSAAKDGDDIRDLPKPPPFRDYVYLGIERPGTATRFAQDMRAAGGDTKSWEIEVVTDGDGRAVTLSWPNAATLPKRLRLKLTDLETGKSINLRSASSYRVDAISREVPRRFRLTAEKGASRALAISGLRAVSMGGAAAGAGGRSVSASYRFDFNLTADAAVTGRILTLTGKPIRTLSAGRAAAVGANALHWDGRGPAGEALPAGAYQVEISARGEGGEIVRERRTILSLR